MTELQIIRLAAIPGDAVRPSDFTIDTIDDSPDSELRPGHVEVQPEYFGLNAGLRSRLGTGTSTTLGPSLSIGDTPRSDAVARITRSESPNYRIGERVVGLLPWQSTVIAPTRELRRLDDATSAIEALTLVGHVGATAYAALVDVGDIGPGDVVWISAAAGGVGCCAVQFARALGGTVIASAGGAERVSYLRDILRVSRVIDRTEDLDRQLDEVASHGIDIYLDLVGGDHLRTALARMNVRGRVVIAGRSGPKVHQPVLADSSEIISKRLRIGGLSVNDHPDSYARVTELVEQVGRTSEPFTAAATVTNGLEYLSEAFCDLLTGKVLGRGVVKTDVGN